MDWKQLRQPNTNVPCTPGWCLKYEQDIYGIPAKYPTALAAWNASQYKHQDSNFPAGMSVPIWFTGRSGLLAEDGHVANRMPDGSVWSASHPTSHMPMHFPSIEALNRYYSDQLIYLGWTEDVEDVKVVEQEEDMSQVTLDVARIEAFFIGGRNGMNGKPNALNGECDDELKANHVGQETNGDVVRWYQSSEEKQSLAFFAALSQQAGQYEQTKTQLDALQAQLKAMPQDTSEAEQKLQAIKDALGIK